MSSSGCSGYCGCPRACANYTAIDLTVAPAHTHMEGISLIVRADDFGLCHAANQAILEGFETGLLTCASLAVVCPWVAEAATLAHGHPEWEIGVQLMLTCPAAGCRWGPVAGAAAVPSLADATGAFPARLPAAARARDL